MTVDQHLITRALADMPVTRAQTLTTSRSGLRARSAAHAAFQTGQRHLQALTAATKYEHPEIAPDVLPEVRSELVKQIKAATLAAFTDPLTGYVRHAERALDEAEAAAAKYRPKFDPENAAQAIRTDQAWNNTIRPMLDDGKGWDEIIPTLDADGLVAVDRFAPAHEARVRDRFHQHEVPAAVDGIRNMSDRRNVDIAPPEGREALREALDAAEAVNYTRTVAGWLQDADARNATSVSIALTRSAYQAGVQQPVDTSPEAQAAYASALAA